MIERAEFPVQRKSTFKGRSTTTRSPVISRSGDWSGRDRWSATGFAVDQMCLSFAGADRLLAVLDSDVNI
jgi:hypothetical protein